MTERKNLIEAMAKNIFNSWWVQPRTESIAWTPNGTSIKQNEARAYVTASLEALEAHNGGCRVVPASFDKDMLACSPYAPERGKE